MEDYDYSFSQNGLVAYKAGELIAEQVCACACVFSCWHRPRLPTDPGRDASLPVVRLNTQNMRVCH